jgi:hypothetical protein
MFIHYLAHQILADNEGNIDSQIGPVLIQEAFPVPMVLVHFVKEGWVEREVPVVDRPAHATKPLLKLGIMKAADY